ncbi:MAG: hypothetical protein R3C49_26185 [Planctomycetaceae bacterium]
MTEQRESHWLKSLLPSSLISLCVHLCVLVLAGLSLKGCDRGVPAPAGGAEFREVGLTMISDRSDTVSDTPKQNPGDVQEIQPANSKTTQNATQSPAIPSEAPSVSELLNSSAAANSQNSTTGAIGAGLPADLLPSSSGGLAEMIRQQGTSGQGSAGSPTPGPGQTSFMNIVSDGRSFVYVIDTSSSMTHGQRLPLARSQLKSSLRMLKPFQKFQVLFYNLEVTAMKLRGRAVEDLYAATAVNLQLAGSEIDRVTAGSSTAHRPAIERALMLEPDVIYFLTDGDHPRLTPADLQQLKRSNRKRIPIHVVEFGSGSRESREISWLMQLATQSGGDYRYVTVE